jgi:hypothetical protein
MIKGWTIVDIEGFPVEEDDRITFLNRPRYETVSNECHLPVGQEWREVELNPYPISLHLRFLKFGRFIRRHVFEIIICMCLLAQMAITVHATALTLKYV